LCLFASKKNEKKKKDFLEGVDSETTRDGRRSTRRAGLRGAIPLTLDNREKKRTRLAC